MYHGSPEERAELRRTEMVIPEADREKWWLGAGASVPVKKQSKSQSKPAKKTSAKQDFFKSKGRKPVVGRSTRARVKKVADDEEDEQEDEEPETAPDPKPLPHQRTTFPVVITTYEIIMKDREHLAMYRWGFIVVDEGHRLKNMECRLMRELKALNADSRMVLTGTPLHVSAPA